GSWPRVVSGVRNFCARKSEAPAVCPPMPGLDRKAASFGRKSRLRAAQKASGIEVDRARQRQSCRALDHSRTGGVATATGNTHSSKLATVLKNRQTSRA